MKRYLHLDYILYNMAPQIGNLGLWVLKSEVGVIKDMVGVMSYMASELLSSHNSYSQVGIAMIWKWFRLIDLLILSEICLFN